MNSTGSVKKCSDEQHPLNGFNPIGRKYFANTNGYLAIAVLVLMILSGCGGRKYRYYTCIHPDGSIYKTVTVFGDSGYVHGRPFPFEEKDGWKITYGKEYNQKDSDSIYVATAEKTFLSIDQIDACFVHQNDSLEKEILSFNMSRNFRWFFTYHTYRETFIQRFPVNHVSIDDYLTEQEQLYLFGEDKTLEKSLNELQLKELEETVSGKWIEFMYESAYREFMMVLNNYALKNGLPAISTSYGHQIRTLFTLENDDLIDSDSICTLIDRFTGLGWATKAYQDGVFDNYNRVFEKSDWHENGENDYECMIETPGVLYDTNGHIVEGNRAKWTFKGEQFQYKDYAMEVHYRTANVWAFVMTGLILFLTVLVWYKAGKRKL